MLRVDVAQNISDYTGTTTTFDEYSVSGTYDGVSYSLVEAGAGGWDVTCTVAGAVLTCDANTIAGGGMPRSAESFRFER